jgi:hypothetical protein
VPLSRRTFLSGSAAAGALLVASGRDVLASPLGGRTGVEDQTTRASRLFPATRVAHADLHNHTLYSDGSGDPKLAFLSMRDAGLDVAALTDHATVGKALPGVTELACAGGGCSLAGMNETSWQDTARLADGANADGSFTSIRGFEWSSPTLGHVNVWFSQDWIDPATTGGHTTGSGLAQFAHRAPGLGPVISPELDAAVRSLPTTGAGMQGFYEWLSRDPRTPLLSGGADAIAGFNHPGREPAASAPSPTTAASPSGSSRWRSSTAARTTCSRAWRTASPPPSPSAWTQAGGWGCSASATSTAPTGATPTARAAPGCGSASSPVPGCARR